MANYNPFENNSLMANYNPYQMNNSSYYFNQYPLQGFQPGLQLQGFRPGPSNTVIINETQQFLPNVALMNHQAAPDPPPPPQERVAVIQDAEEFSRNLPPGYRFRPTEEELVMNYLRKKSDKQLLPIDIIPMVELYSQHPEELTANYPFAGDEEAWYFFTTLERKYLNGRRPSRTASDGFWKPTGVDKVICSGGSKVGFKKTLDYYSGKHKQGHNRKTCWKMHEYRTEKMNLPPSDNSTTNNMKIDGIFLCKIYSKKVKGKKNDQNGDHATAFIDATSQRSEETVEEPPPPPSPDNGATASNAPPADKGAPAVNAPPAYYGATASNAPPAYYGVPASNGPPAYNGAPASNAAPNNSPFDINGACSSCPGEALPPFDQQNYRGVFMNEQVPFGPMIMPLRSMPPVLQSPLPAWPTGHRSARRGGRNHHANRQLVNQEKEYSRPPPAQTRDGGPREQAAPSEFRLAQPDGSVHNNGDHPQDASFTSPQLSDEIRAEIMKWSN